jgi:hypothetical protein
LFSSEPHLITPNNILTYLGTLQLQ